MSRIPKLQEIETYIEFDSPFTMTSKTIPAELMESLPGNLQHVNQDRISHGSLKVVEVEGLGKTPAQTTSKPSEKDDLDENSDLDESDTSDWGDLWCEDPTPFEDLRLPANSKLEKHHPELYHAFEAIQAEYDELLSTSERNNNKESVDRFIHKVGELYERQFQTMQQFRLAIIEAKMSEKKRTRLIFSVNQNERQLLVSRRSLRGSKRRLAGQILSHTPPTELGTAFCSRFPNTAPVFFREEWHKQMSGIECTVTGCTDEQLDFQNTLIAAYHDVRKVNEKGRPMIWDPIFGGWTHRFEAVHIVPIKFGGEEFTELIGTSHPRSDDVYQAMWTAENGLLLSREFASRFRKDFFAIVEDKEADSDILELKVVILNDSFKSYFPPTLKSELKGGRYWTEMGDIDGRRLTWQNKQRPSVTNLYLRHMLARLMRKRELRTDWAI